MHLCDQVEHQKLRFAPLSPSVSNTRPLKGDRRPRIDWSGVNDLPDSAIKMERAASSSLGARFSVTSDDGSFVQSKHALPGRRGLHRKSGSGLFAHGQMSESHQPLVGSDGFSLTLTDELAPFFFSFFFLLQPHWCEFSRRAVECLFLLCLSSFLS